MQQFGIRISWVWLALFMVTCTNHPQQVQKKDAPSLDQLAQDYVRLGLTLGQHDKNYVDAYYGPEAWKPDPTATPPSLEAIKVSAETLSQSLKTVASGDEGSLLWRRHLYLEKQLEAMLGRIDFLQGKHLSFDEEAKRIYDAEPPTYSEQHFQSLLAELDTLIPGEEPLSRRLQTFRDAFVIPPETLDNVFKTAIEEARKRTAPYLSLPEGESFEVSYVTDKPWSGYNWYQGNYKSLIQVNTDLPITIDRAIDLACHEGYPGHHVYNVLLEKHLVHEKGWKEFSFYPLFSPQSLIAEGTANYGIPMAFPNETRIRYEKDVLFPLAGLDPNQAERYYQVMAILKKLKYAGNEAARGYLNQAFSQDKAVSWLTDYAMMSEPKARQRIQFFDTYRAYVINYNLGEDLVAAYVDAKAEKRHGSPGWDQFKTLLSAPWVPSLLTAE